MSKVQTMAFIMSCFFILTSCGGGGGGGGDSDSIQTSLDSDGDGYSDVIDCAPNNPSIYPGATDYGCENLKVCSETVYLNNEANYAYYYSFDEYGNRSTKELDAGANGTTDSIDTYSYDANGNQVSLTKDTDVDGIPDAITTYTYVDDIDFDFDFNDQLMSVEVDSDADGIPESITTYTYSINDPYYQVTRNYVDSDTDVIFALKYDDTGNLVISSKIDLKGPIYVYEFIYTYDDDNNMTSFVMDYPWDNGETIESKETYTYDPTSGLQLTLEEDQYNDGSVDYREEYSYDEAGNMLSLQGDENADGSIEFIDAYAYDEMGNLLSYQEDDGADGQIDYAEVYTYDEYGKELTYSVDNGGDGVFEKRTVYDYDCWQ